MKVIIANHVPYADTSAIELVEYALLEWVKKNNLTKKDLKEYPDCPYLVSVEITVQSPVCAPSPGKKSRK